jgi:mannose-1-phosphate guanylyltransferase
MVQHDLRDIHHTERFPNLHGLIICSNSASHLWPISREQTPLELACDADSGLSPLARAIRAIRPYCVAPLIIATPHSLAPAIREHIARYALLTDKDYRLLIEPHPRGGALTTALAAATVKLVDPHATLLCLPSTISFGLDDRWPQTLKRVYQVAERRQIALVGSSVAPTTGVSDGRERERARTGALYGTPAARGHEVGGTFPLLGAIRMGQESKDVAGSYQVRSFIARPAPPIAWRAQQGRSLWSTHIFALKADLALAELRLAGRDTTDPTMQSVQRIAETARFFVSLGDEHWGSREASELVGTLPTLSFEEAVFETTKLLTAVPTSISFTDLATFAGYERTVETDARGNRLRGRALAVETGDSTILANGNRLVVALGLEGAVVIDTADATLVTTRDALEAIPSVLAALKSAGAPEL